MQDGGEVVANCALKKNKIVVFEVEDIRQRGNQLLQFAQDVDYIHTHSYGD